MNDVTSTFVMGEAVLYLHMWETKHSSTAG